MGNSKWTHHNRPPAAPPLSEGQRTLLKIANETVTARSPEGPVTMRKAEALRRKQFATAMSGSPHAQRQALAALDEAERVQRREIEERNAFWSAYKARQLQAVKRAQTSDSPVSFPLPHPMDIEICPEDGVTFHGPCCEATLKAMQTAKQTVVAWIYQDALDARASGRRGEAAIERGSSAWQAFRLNATLPPSLRYSKDAFIELRLGANRLPKRELLKQTRAAWAEAGQNVPRGTIYAPSADAEHIEDEVQQLFEHWRETDFEVRAVGKLVDAFISRLARRIGVSQK